MQYETIILELLSRIKKLEEDVEELKQSRVSNIIEQENSVSVPSVSYTKMTDEMIEICYKCGQMVFKGENAQELADDVAEETGMNRNSAFMYIYVVSSLLSGEVFKRAISKKALEIYFKKIYQDYGSDGLKNAIKATRLHIDYRKSCGHTDYSIEEACDKAEARL